jgi:ABC-type transport system involved in cytochrome c biogenesis permease subunit
MRGPDGTRLLVIGVPMLLLITAVELMMVLHPGDAVLPDPHDELLMFFRSRMLAAGYSVAVLSLAALYVVSLFELRYLEMLLPVVLALTVLVPGLVYRRLDRRAGADE